MVEVARDGALRFAPRLPGPPPRVDGHLPALTSPEHAPPHLGERHPDGDELILLVSGQVTVIVKCRAVTSATLFAPAGPSSWLVASGTESRSNGRPGSSTSPQAHRENTVLPAKHRQEDRDE